MFPDGRVCGSSINAIIIVRRALVIFTPTAFLGLTRIRLPPTQLSRKLSPKPSKTGQKRADETIRGSRRYMAFIELVLDRAERLIAILLQYVCVVLE